MRIVLLLIVFAIGCENQSDEVAVHSVRGELRREREENPGASGDVSTRVRVTRRDWRHVRLSSAALTKF
jgi:hypothetical protein